MFVTDTSRLQHGYDDADLCALRTQSTMRELPLSYLAFRPTVK
jgi:hypothetical protein